MTLADAYSDHAGDYSRMVQGSSRCEPTKSGLAARVDEIAPLRKNYPSIETCKRAILKLESQLAQASKGPWVKQADFEEYVTRGTKQTYAWLDGPEREPTFVPADAALVETLRDTAEAQLAVLRNYTEVYGDENLPVGIRHALTNLAEKILGEDL